MDLNKKTPVFFNGRLTTAQPDPQNERNSLGIQVFTKMNAIHLEVSYAALEIIAFLL